MRSSIGLFLSTVLISGCGGGGDSGNSTAKPVPVGTVSGTTFDGLISSGDVKVYDFSSGSKGALLASATTDRGGLYSLSLQIESRPVWVELTGGFYNEEADLKNVILQPGHKLVAVANYTTGTPLTVAVTTYSYLATGLAQYQIKHGTAADAAINNANSRISGLVGVNILGTIPKEITDIGNASAALTPELQYGFLAGAISKWTFDHAPSPSIDRKIPYTSIDFAQLLYNDILADGLLDGFGVNSAGAKTPLSFNTTPLGPDVYRLGLGAAILQMAGDANNKIGIDSARLMPFATSYVGSTDPIFNNAAPIAIPAPAVSVASPTANSAVKRIIDVSATAQAVAGVQSFKLYIDGKFVADADNNKTPAVSFDTAAYSAGVHVLSMRVIDFGGQATSNDVSILIDNTSPVASNTSSFMIDNTDAGPLLNAIVLDGHASDNASGVLTIRNLQTGAIAYPDAHGNWRLGPFTSGRVGNYYADEIEVKDKAGNCSKYNAGGAGHNPLIMNNVTWSLLASDYIC